MWLNLTKFCGGGENEGMSKLNDVRLIAINSEVINLQEKMQNLHNKGDETQDKEIGRQISELLAEKHRIEHPEGSEGKGR